AEGLVTQDEVRIAGVKAGHVVAVDPAPDGTTLVTMLLDPGIRVRRDTQAVVRPKSLLGTQLVQLIRKPGSNARYLNEGETIPKAQTGEAVEVDSVLNNMDPPTRAAFSQSLQELGVALENRSGDVNTSIPQVDQVVSNFRPLAPLGDRRQPAHALARHHPGRPAHPPRPPGPGQLPERPADRDPGGVDLAGAGVDLSLCPARCERLLLPDHQHHGAEHGQAAIRRLAA